MVTKCTQNNQKGDDNNNKTDKRTNELINKQMRNTHRNKSEFDEFQFKNFFRRRLLLLLVLLCSEMLFAATA